MNGVVEMLGGRFDAAIFQLTCGGVTALRFDPEEQCFRG